MKSRFILFAGGMIFWALLSWPPDYQHIITGIFVCGLTAWITGGLFTVRIRLLGHLDRYLWFLYYVVILIWECLKANLDVAYRVAHPALPIKPGIVKVKTNLKSDTGLTFLANSITLTPGTLTVDVDKENGFLYIHWINVIDQNSEAATEMIVRKFEKILSRIFE